MDRTASHGSDDDASTGAIPAAQRIGDRTIAANVGERAPSGDDTLGFFVPDDLPAEKAGESIGRYTLLKEIGRGGFGTVWLADQKEPVKRQVALKIIKLGMDTRQVVARFEQERQALAMMDHPNIARVLDAGATATGRPFFVMEFVKGEPIVDYCTRTEMSIANRLELLATVTAAVQHAHAKGIIHRDLKPSNILVGEVDGRPHPTVIDFGIAKATSTKLTEKTLVTAEEQIIGTLNYMSPEQADGRQDIDTRTDIYSLGVILYELLTGKTPFDDEESSSAGIDEMRRRIREDEPQTPSSRISTAMGRSTSVSTASTRKTGPRRLSAYVRGDLDWIVMKALEKDRDRRYETANGLAMDIRRFLSGEPVLAAPPSAGYRLKKFVRRHKGMVGAGSAVALSLIAGIVAFAWQARIAATERDNAWRAEGVAARERSLAETARQAAEAQKIVAEQKRVEAEAARAEAEKQKALAEEKRRAEEHERIRAVAMSTFISDALRAADPNYGGNQALLVTDAMANAVRQLDNGAFATDPDIEASLRSLIAEIYSRNAKETEALRMARESLRLYEQVYDDDDNDHVAKTLNLIATLQQNLGDRVGAERIFLQTLAIQKKLHPTDHEDVAKALNNVGTVKIALGKTAEALPYIEDSLAMHRRLAKGDKSSIAMLMNNLAAVYDSIGRQKDSVRLHEESLDMYKRLYTEHPQLAMALLNLGQARTGEGRMIEAESLIVQAEEMYARLFTGGHADTARAMLAVGNVKKNLGKVKEAEASIMSALEMLRRLFPGAHPLTASALADLARLRRETAHPDLAEALIRESLAMRRELQQGDAPDTADALDQLASCLRDQKKWKEAEAASAEMLAIRKRLAPFDDLSVVRAMNRHGDLLCNLDRAADAEKEAREALAMAKRLFKDDSPDVAVCMTYLSRALQTQKKHEEAAPLLEESVAMLTRVYQRDHIDVAVGWQNLGGLRQDAGKDEEAYEAFKTALEMHRRLTPKGSMSLLRALEDVAKVELKLHHRDEAIAHFKEAVNIAARYLAKDHPRLVKLQELLEDAEDSPK